MNHRQTETSKEIRLWISQVFIPVGMILGMVFGASPEAREYVKDKSRKAKEKIKTTVNKW
jgi:hypothetical protein